MSEEKYIELFSKARIDSYSSIDEHEANFEILGKIAPKISQIEVIIRNRIDSIMSQRNKNWLFDICLQSRDAIMSQNTLISKQTFGFWVKVARHYKIEQEIFKTSFLNNYSFKKYYEKNTNRANRAHLYDWQIASLILGLVNVIRNRAFHSENLLKIQENGLPRLSTKVDFDKNTFAIKRVSPDKLVIFLNDILKSFDESLIK